MSDVRYPELLNEWDFASNYLLCSPSEILSSYSKNVWWNCGLCGRKYELSPKAKILYQKRKMLSCKYCKGYRRKKVHYF
ncbi:zinc-ribbon domain-containing protein [Butyrivibrio proteoclasticus]|uniref:zinc-ribbon domain-containing protein n=1 Tax=Butyrivibrio proteoclasticus TaxID=43305 RepID=UPI000943B67F